MTAGPAGSSTLPAEIAAKLEACRLAAKALRSSSGAKRSAVLEAAARLLSEKQAEVIAANQQDLQALAPDATLAFRDRLTINASRIPGMQESLAQVASLPDPLGEEVESRTLANGLRVRRVRSPLGVILMIFESRPNVALESFSLAFKSGNVILLRGGKESMRTTAVIYRILEQALVENGFSKDCLWGITNPDRALTLALLQQRQWIDVVVPRGGDALIEFVVQNSKIPIIKNDRGMCHVYVHEDADLEMAAQIVANAKTHRPGVCNAMETLLVHDRIHAGFLPKLYEALKPKGVEWHADAAAFKALKGREKVQSANPVDWDTEHLDLIMNCRVVSSMDEAVEHIEKHGSRHSEAIVTSSAETARRFESEVDAAAVYWNASTRFTDGFELGLGGELGISTQKLHVRGPVGLKELTSIRWIIEGDGQTRS